MEDSGSLTNRIINRNWVLKRKRRKIPFGPDKSNGNKTNCTPSESHTNSLPTLKDDIASDRSSSKKKGHDGYYYECVICDLGGNLLCCDSCPETYHLQCLDPPLKRIPNGKWQCPKCCLKNSPVDATVKLDPVSKRARTKIVVGKSKSGSKSVRTDKVSRILGSSITGKKGSSSKGKSSLSHPGEDASCATKLSHPSDDGSAENHSSFSDVDTGKKLDSSPKDVFEETKPVSSGRPDLSLPTFMELKTKEETSGRKPDLSCGEGSPGKNGVPMLDASIIKTRKRKHKVPFGDLLKKPRTDEGKHAADNSRKRGSKAHLGSVGTSKPQRKRKAVHGTSASLSKNPVGREIVVVPVKNEAVKEAAYETGKVVDGTVTHEDPTPDEVQQVDRVLACRIQGSAVISMADTTDTHQEDLVNLDNHKQTSEGNPSSNSTPQMMDTENLTAGAEDNLSHSDQQNRIEDDMRVKNIDEDERSLTNDCREEDTVPAVTSDVNPTSTAVNDESNGTPALSEQTLTGENVDVNPRCHDNSELGEGHERPNSPDIAAIEGVDVEMETDSSHKKKNKESVLVDSLSSNGESISYEFLVKWVGKSHIHNSWVSESQLKVLAKRKLDNYKSKFGTAVINICEDQWKLPQRVVALNSSANGSTKAFVKWTGLPYDECTWEKINEPVIANSSHLIDQFMQFERQAIEKDASKDDAPRRKGNTQKMDVVTLNDQPKELVGGSLFPHQLEALNWLRKCWQISKNVILADEMGLGKTVSALSFLSSLNFEFKVRLPSLVLVPLSTMPNWMAEFSLWAPNLNVVEYHGGAKARALIRQYEWHASIPDGSKKKTETYKFNVLLTTYEMVLADSSHLRGVPWEVLVVDEGHRLKNSSSKLFGLLNTFSFQHRVLLTGTPLQNNLGEMYNLLNFLQPTSFPSLSSFEENFNDLTTAEKVEELKKLVAPHMLRRLKRDAMQNIPPKTERIVPVELSSVQAKYYRAMLTKNYQLLRNIGKGVGQQSMLNIVMQLRKICNHPYLMPGTEPENGTVEFLHDMRITASAKLTLLHSMLRVLHKEGHRVLIFSQMTKLLDILEDYLNIEFGPKAFERVDGSVSVADRQTAIARFNQDKNRFVFLLSTRSCGLGINLATADTVIIYDSDFNPHADIQAMNRAHRIGQSKRLLVYRLVVRASVEERILQLAKKKLMLDQLFVNKSESQKEVEDILRWGTEELFNDYSSVSGKDSGDDNNKREASVDVEQKHKRRTGGLGDVYQDKCTDGNPKIVWDENAIMKLLDRSTLPSGSPDNAEGDLENDMLGSVKSLEWTDEPTEEQGGTESVPVVTDDTSAENSKKEDASGIATEENEWDRLLKERWENYKAEKEKNLGRGKRRRKAVSYREACAAHHIETLSEHGAAEEPEPEPEPEREYTTAGRALKAKYAKLRARQKERLTRRKAAEASFLLEGPSVHESFPFPSSNVQDGKNVPVSDQNVAEKALTINIDDDQDQTLEAQKSKAEQSLRLGKTSKLKMSSHMDMPMKHFGPHALDHFLPNHRLQGTDCVNSVPSSNLLPVLGLCAPNANPMESSQRSSSRSYSKQRRHGVGMDFPFHIAPCSGTSNEIDVRGHENVSDKFKLPNVSSESIQHQQKTGIPDHSLPFSSHNFAAPRGKAAEASESSGTFPDYPKLPFDEKLLPELPFPGRNLPHLQPNLFPGLSLGSRIGVSNNSSAQELPMMPLLPNLKFPQDTSLYSQQEREVHPTLGLGQMLPTLSSFPENHRKVLENILMRTGSGGSSNMPRKKLIKDYWSEDELDFLWIGVRRHGRGSWDAMLRDPRLKFSKFRTEEDLSARWEEEQLKLSDAPAIPTQKPMKATKSGKSPSSFPSISDGMMKRALHGSRFAGPLKFQPHLTDMKLGFGDLPSSLPPHLEASDQLGLHHDHLPPIPSWNSEKFRANFLGDPSAGPSDRPGTSSNVHMEQPFMLNSLGTSSLGSLGLNGTSSGLDLPLKEDELRATRPWTLPNFMDQSLNLLRESRGNVRSGEAENSALLNVSHKFKGKEQVAVGNDSSSENRLPHWLRKAVSAPSARPTEIPDLPPTVSAIAQSVRLLYGDKSPTIPPFVVPGLPPPRPKDPRRIMKKKKKKKHRSSSFFPQDVPGSNHYIQSNLHGEYAGSSSTAVKQDPPFPLLSQIMGTSEEMERIEPNLNLPSLSLNMLNLAASSSSLPSNPKNKTSSIAAGLTPSPEVLQLVVSCMLPTPALAPGSTSSSLPESKTPLDTSEQGQQDQAHIAPPLGSSSSPKVDKTEETASGDSSKTPSDPSMRQQPGGDKVEEEEVSSEGTVSDHRVSDHES